MQIIPFLIRRGDYNCHTYPSRSWAEVRIKNRVGNELQNLGSRTVVGVLASRNAFV